MTRAPFPMPPIRMYRLHSDHVVGQPPDGAVAALRPIADGGLAMKWVAKFERRFVAFPFLRRGPGCPRPLQTRGAHNLLYYH